VVEIPPLELEPDFDAAIVEASTTADRHEVDDEPLAIDDGGVPAIDLGLDVVKEEEAPPLVFEGLAGETPVAPTIAELESRVADDPDDAEAHQALGEALIEGGERERGIEELDIATGGFETADNLAHAQGLVDEILRLDPNSVRHRQKQVEFAFKAGDKSKLIEAYLELADTLLRGDLADKARAVYERVVEHDPKNDRARAALAMLAPPPEPPKREGKVAAKDAKMRVRDETEGDAGDFVDLAAMILEEEEGPRDTRMKVEDEEPTGDEEQDFREMLARFRQGIDENIEETDFQSHYDLGVAFKEMGLLDEAIAEFQKALRAPEGKLRTSEALGVCFHDKGAFGVAESILRRALDLPSSGDQERLGILYWLGRSLEEQGKTVDARDLYGRVFAVDIRFMDVGARVKALAKAR
jgi:tetratricopeptide (TPR) repeat protein